MKRADARGVDRRAFLKSAVAIGGSAALAACVERDGMPDLPRGDAPDALPDRQHAWNVGLPTDEHGNVRNARHHVLLLLDYDGDGEPTASDRDTTREAFAALDRAYPWAAEGLLSTVGYSPAYFERFDADLPDGVDLPEPAALSPFEQPVFDTPDAVVHLASDYAQVVLAAENVLRGRRDDLNGVAVPSLDALFTVADRRTGFVGEGLPADHQDVEGIPESESVPEDAPLYMGFKSGFEKNQATEDNVTIQSGPFAGGTTEHVSQLKLRLDDWYGEQDHEDRVAEMFCPFHAEEGLVEGTGESLGDDTRVTDGCVENRDEHARSYGRVGHSQKTAAAREDGEPLILRRDFDSTDGGEAGLHFVALQDGIGDFVETREAMNGTDLTEHPAIRQRVNNGILEYTFVERRGNYLVPPRRVRALPTPNP